MKRVIAAAVATGFAVAVGVSAGAAVGAKPKPTKITCSATIGVMGGFTGARAAIGEEELRFSKLAVARFNQQHHSNIHLLEGDIQVDPSKASLVGQQFASNKKVVAVVGPDASFAVDAAGPIFTRAHLGFISGSATRVTLTNGQYPTFFRVVPNDGVQGPTDARFMIQQLHAKKVMLVDNQTDYSTGLNASVADVLQKAGVTVVKGSTSTTQNDFASLIATIGSDVVRLTFSA